MTHGKEKKVMFELFLVVLCNFSFIEMKAFFIYIIFSCNSTLQPGVIMVEICEPANV